MTREDARLILDAHTLAGSGGVEVDQDLRAAQDVMSRDAGLQKWFQSRSAGDERLAQAFAGVQVPAGLQDRLLKLEQPAAPILKFPVARRMLLAIAAIVVLSLGGLLWHTTLQKNAMPRWESDSLAMVQQLDSGRAPLDHTSHDMDAIKGFLAQAASPIPSGLPKNLTPGTTVGCKKFLADGRSASVVCFEIAPGVLAHLVTVSAGPEVSGAQVGKPEFAQAGGEWHTAMWSDGKQTYILGTRALMEQLQHLFT